MGWELVCYNINVYFCKEIYVYILQCEMYNFGDKYKKYVDILSFNWHYDRLIFLIRVVSSFSLFSTKKENNAVKCGISRTICERWEKEREKVKEGGRGREKARFTSRKRGTRQAREIFLHCCRIKGAADYYREDYRAHCVLGPGSR